MAARLRDALATDRDQPAGRPRSPLVAATLSFVFPGIGQWYVGRRREAILFAAPVAILVLFVLFQAASGLTAFLVRLFDPSVALTLLILIVILGGWRLLSIVGASGGFTRRAHPKRGSLAIVALLAAAVVATHAGAAYFAWSFYEAGSQIFVGANPDGGDQPAAGSGSPFPTDDYNVAPFETPKTASSRITLLFTGIDKTTTRDHALNDTLLVVSIDPATRAMSMVSFPRDLAEFPMYTGGKFLGKINSLMSFVAGHPDQFPDAPLPTLAKELSFLLGTPIQYFAAIDLDGFQRMIGVAGGVTVNVERAISDPMYDWLDGSAHGFYLSAGVHTLDARTALAFVRSRYGIGDNDFTRAARQQQLLLALRSTLSQPAMIARVPALLQIAGQTIRTNFPAGRLDEMLLVAQNVDSKTIQRYVLQPPTFSIHPPTASTGGSYILRLNWDAVRQLSVDLYGDDSTFWTGQYSPSGSPVPAAATIP